MQFSDGWFEGTATYVSCFALYSGKLHWKTHEILRIAVRDNAIRIIQLFSWFRRGKILFENFENCSQPATAHTNKNMEKVCKVITKDWQSSILEIAGGFSLSYGSRLQIVREDFGTGGRSLLRLCLYYLQMNRSRSRFGGQNMVVVPKPFSLIFGPLWFLHVTENEITSRSRSFPVDDCLMCVPCVPLAVAQMLNPLLKFRHWCPVTKVKCIFC